MARGEGMVGERQDRVRRREEGKLCVDTRQQAVVLDRRVLFMTESHRVGRT